MEQVEYRRRKKRQGIKTPRRKKDMCECDYGSSFFVGKKHRLV